MFKISENNEFVESSFVLSQGASTNYDLKQIFHEDNKRVYS